MPDVNPTRGGQVQAGAREQKAECPRCRDFLCFDTDWIGRLVEWCPHCDEGRPHTRQGWLARFAEEDALVIAPADQGARSRVTHCAECSEAIPDDVDGRCQYCSPQCRRAAAARRKRDRKRKQCKTKGCPNTTLATWCKPCVAQVFRGMRRTKHKGMQA